MCIERLDDRTVFGRAETAVKTALLVEDELLIRLGIADDLRDSGFDVIEAATADAARALFEQHPEIDCLVTDVRMPGQMDGLELARLVATERPEVKIVIMSGQWPARSAPPPSAITLNKPFANARVVRILKGALGKG